MKQEGCKDREAREGQGRKRTYRTFYPFESCRSSAVDYIEEISLESPKKTQDEQEVTSEASGNDEYRNVFDGENHLPEKKKTGGGWKPEGERRRRKPKFLWNGVEGASP